MALQRGGRPGKAARASESMGLCFSDPLEFRASNMACLGSGCLISGSTRLTTAIWALHLFILLWRFACTQKNHSALR